MHCGQMDAEKRYCSIIDAERVFNYRSLCFAGVRHLLLPGFDENLYAGELQCQRPQLAEPGG